MDSTSYHNLLSAFLNALQRDPMVIGLIALGSTAEPALRDRWSDHDFWIITQGGREDHYLGSTDWMPDAKNILLTTRHGEHYRTVLYKNGHKVEYGVFEPSTAFQGKIERYSVLLERGGMVGMAKEVRDEARRVRREQLVRPSNLANLAILAWTFHERLQRGEWLAGARYLSMAVDLLLDLLTMYVLPEDDKWADFLDPRRRLEQRRPDIARELREIVSAADETSGPKLLKLAGRELKTEAPELEWAEVDKIREWMEEE